MPCQREKDDISFEPLNGACAFSPAEIARYMGVSTSSIAWRVMQRRTQRLLVSHNRIAEQRPVLHTKKDPMTIVDVNVGKNGGKK